MLCLVTMWGLVIWFINPVGEFMINDDWSFVKALEVVSVQGVIPATGWGDGGPSLLTHLVWGYLFTKLFGFSVTVLRISVLVMGVLGSLVFFILLRRSGASPLLALLGTSTLVLNPLFLSQSFTFMTDVTFAGLLIFAVLLISEGMKQENKVLLGIGLFFTLAALLTRQIAIVVPIALIISTLIHPGNRAIGFRPVVLMCLVIAIIPWLAFEYSLKKLGSTSLTDHEVIHAIVRDPLQLGVLGYFRLLLDRLLIGIGYVSFMISPVIALSFKELYSQKIFRIYFLVVSFFFVLLEICILTGVVHPPVAFYRNVIFDFGIGPLLLKDTYVLQLSRSFTIPAYLYYCIFYWATVTTGAIALLIQSSLSSILRQSKEDLYKPTSFTSTFALANAAVYSGIILLTGYHDRYLIPVCFLLLIWVISYRYRELDKSLWSKSVIPALVSIAFMAMFSVTGVHDLMSTKTALKEAQDFLMNDRAVPPCKMDGGFEFNGYHCYEKNFVKKPGLSWWWVDSENYLLTLGPLDGYKVERIFPFRRIFLDNGAVYVLKNDSEINSHHADLGTR